MRIDCLLAGVGGQGTVLASKIIAQTAISNQCFARTSETIGMAQRGGCVVSHVRIGDQNCSPAIPIGMADLIIGFEPAEALRNIGFLKSDGQLLVNINPIIPVTSSLGGSSYQAADMIDYLQSTRRQAVFVDGQKLCAAAGTAKVLNVIMLGVAIKQQLLPFSREEVLTTITENLPAKFLELNRKALEIGYNFQQYV
ncbi:indolepyruvate oxidoreductase subunit B [Sporomusa ovata DSM 2662]|uniref:Indolepyruvate oxidoreductase subunit IorB n=1 Tax=Sporomusa ovata TaxID=2378 RepID=A0A0U1KZH3_9FIRM|nr:indolepyruvate oxidoreductase subunit beta [Sporomusa ovata]EQB29551.1 indolepyruvate oxidoreductase subunit IorB [Sporomusa ovata DSM 2662]CQR72064.1 Indolepyruvate oxidoreductase subunit IorB [Sporomusa ovata]